MRRAAAVTLALVIALALVAGGCSRASAGRGDELRLDGRPRIPDDEGVATALSADSITLDGRRTYEVSDQLRAFSTYDLAPEPMIGRRGQYVQIGLEGDTMVWMAGIARVLELDGRTSVLYQGRFVREVAGRLVFDDGTTFETGPDVSTPPKDRDLTVRVDVRTHRVVSIT